MLLTKAEKRLRILSVVLTVIFLTIIFIPLLLLLSYSLQDQNAIYTYPPKLVPPAAKSVSIVVDYSGRSGESAEKIRDDVLRDSAMALYSTISVLNNKSINEIKVYGTMNGKTIFYQRAQQMQLWLEMDYGIYYGSLRMDRTQLFTDSKYLKSAERIGYQFDPSGLKAKAPTGNLTADAMSAPVGQVLNDAGKDRALLGRFEGTKVTTNDFLWLESYKYYWKVPEYLFSNIASIRQFSLLSFLTNTVIVTIWDWACETVLCSVTAYALSRLFSKRMADIILLFFLITLMIPFMCTMVPMMLMMKSWGVLNTYGAMLIPYLAPSAFYIWLFKGFFDRLPQDLLDAAKIDGASQLFVYWNICMPLSKPIISVISVNILLNAWNDFLWLKIAANKTELWTINLALYNITATAKENVLMGLSMLSILPIMALTLIFSKQIKASLMGGAIKG